MLLTSRQRQDTTTTGNNTPPTSSASQPLNAIAIPGPSLSIPTIENDNISNINDAHDDNVSFLRSRVRSSPDSSSSLSRQRRRRQQQQHQILPEFNDPDPMDLDDPQTLRIPVEINHRIPIVRRQRDEQQPAHMPNYEGRHPHTRSLYGWAPGSEEDEEEDDEQNDPIYEPLPEGISSWFGRLSDRPLTSRRNPRRDAVGRSPPPPPPLPPFSTDNFHPDGDRHRLTEHPTAMAEALLQTVRRQSRFSRTRTLQNYILDRERADREAEDGRERSRAYRFLPASSNNNNSNNSNPSNSSSSNSNNNNNNNNNNIEPPHQTLTHNDLRARISAHRQMHTDNPPSPRLTETIKYLDRLRDSTSFEESLTFAAGGGFSDWALDEDDDFILDTASISPPPQSSWLRPGMVFSGSQKAAATGASTLFPQRTSSPPQSSSNDPMIVNGSDSNNGRISVFTTNGRRYLANNIYSLGNGRDENWPVKVTIHDINYDDMTLSGTMEAYNIPDKTSTSQDAHIVTFLEGEIIDFHTHTLETKNFKADAEIDSTYWRELHPFKDLTDEEMARNLVNRKWITEELSNRWILMRWKGMLHLSCPPFLEEVLLIMTERCFITPTDSRQGLTIFGFYYISINREDGHIEGLYYDPGSSPYQQLSLKPETGKMVCPAYQFR